MPTPGEGEGKEKGQRAKGEGEGQRGRWKGKIERGGESGLVGNLSNRLVSVSEKVAALGEPLCFEILTGRLADLAAKEQGKARPGKAEATRGIFQEMAFPQIASEIIDCLLDARMPARIAGLGIGAVAEEERAFHSVKCQEFALRQTGPQNRINKDEFLQDSAAEFGPQVQVSHARA